MPSNMYTARRSREMYTRRKMYTERRSREKLRVMRSRELSGCSQLAAVQSGVMVVAPFTASPGFALLDNHASLRLVADAVHEDDALALALACTPLRDALFARFPRLPADHVHAGHRIRTRDAAVVATAGRLAWVLGLGEGRRPAWLELGSRPHEVAARVARLGGLAALQWVWQLDVLRLERERPVGDNGCDWGWMTCAAAARGGHLGVLKWARENGCEWSWRTCSFAARGGHLGVLQWARENGCEWDWQTCIEAAQGGHLGVLMWALRNGVPSPECYLDRQLLALAAARGGHLEVLQWARQNCSDDQFLWSARTCCLAARSGHLEVLQWARENGCPWDTTCCSAAARGGHLRVLQWARENGCAWWKETCFWAARGGHLGVLQWARENGCEWGAKTCMGAVVGGHLEVLQWAVQNDCAWDIPRCLEAAQDYHHPAVEAWIVWCTTVNQTIQNGWAVQSTCNVGCTLQ